MSNVKKLKAPTLPHASSSAPNLPTLGSEETTTTPEQLGISADDLAVKEEDNSETGKMMQLLGILRKMLNVKDLSSVRISLPAQLMEPIGNLESWTYISRPDYLASVSESDDELERMLAVLRFMFTKDLPFVKAKIAKPYNSILGEHFHCHYDVNPLKLNPRKEPVPVDHLDLNPSPEVISNAGKGSARPTPSTSASTSTTKLASSSASIASARSAKSDKSPPTEPTSVSSDDGTTRVIFLNEQTSHHPPVSCFHIESRGPKGTVKLIGCDQLAAKFTGTSVQVTAGSHNKGLFVQLPDRGEEYHISHPTAIVAGLLKGSPYATISDQTFITSSGTKERYRAIVNYPSESWVTKAKYLVDGVIYRYDEGEPDKFTKPKQVPLDKVVATFEGCWRGEIRYKTPSDLTPRQLVHLVPINVAPKIVAPLDTQDATETRRVWNEVTDALLKKQYSLASKRKQDLEQKQRDKAEARKKSGEPYVPTYFVPEGEEWDGKPVLSEEGKKKVEKQFLADYS